ncbi:MAG: iron-containing alcohol dehydrogenase [Alphaproteobacteria bacterium]
MANVTANWNFPTLYRLGNGRIAELADACKETGITRPLLVTDPGLANLPMIAEALERCKKSGVPVALFCDIKPNPVEANISAGVVAYRDGGHDGVIAFGGGSALDCGKLIAFMAGQSRPVWDFEDVDDWWTRASTQGIAPIIAVPTTAGTGSEMGRAGVVTNEATHEKKIIFHPQMLPAIVIADPELTVGLPEIITIGTGMDALAHCLEAYCAPSYHPMAEGIAVEGLRLVKENLAKVVANPANLEARANMMVAAAMGAVAFQKGLGAIHSLSHPVGAIYNTHHGLTNAVFMPYVLAFNRPVIGDKMQRLSAWLGLPEGGYEGFFNWVLKLRRDFRIPHTLPELGVENPDIDAISASAFGDPSTGGNPREFTTGDAKRLYEAAMTGALDGLSS